MILDLYWVKSEKAQLIISNHVNKEFPGLVSCYRITCKYDYNLSVRNMTMLIMILRIFRVYLNDGFQKPRETT